LPSRCVMVALSDRRILNELGGQRSGWIYLGGIGGAVPLSHERQGGRLEASAAKDRHLDRAGQAGVWGFIHQAAAQLADGCKLIASPSQQVERQVLTNAVLNDGYPLGNLG